MAAFVATNLAGLQPRFVLKRELLLDPCLDVVGARIPNYFLDGGANDCAPEGRDLGPDMIVAWHVGFEGLDTFAGILVALNRRFPPIRFTARRVASADVLRDDRFDA